MYNSHVSILHRCRVTTSGEGRHLLPDEGIVLIAETNVIEDLLVRDINKCLVVVEESKKEGNIYQAVTGVIGGERVWLLVEAINLISR